MSLGGSRSSSSSDSSASCEAGELGGVMEQLSCSCCCCIVTAERKLVSVEECRNGVDRVCCIITAQGTRVLVSIEAAHLRKLVWLVPIFSTRCSSEHNGGCHFRWGQPCLPIA